MSVPAPQPVKAAPYPYCPGPGDEATWGPVTSPLDPRWDDDEDTPEEDVDDGYDGPEEDYSIWGRHRPLFGEIIQQLLEPGSTAHYPPPELFENAAPKRRKYKPRTRAAYSIEEWAEVIQNIVTKHQGIRAGTLRKTTGITSNPWKKVVQMLDGKLFCLKEGKVHRYFIGAKPESRAAQHALFNSAAQQI